MIHGAFQILGTQCLLNIFWYEIACSVGWYGDNCSHQCAGHCKHNIACNHVTGQCDGGCIKGWFNENCSQQCVGQCREDITCNETTGFCDKGCDAGWSGYKCDKGIVILLLV